VTAIIETMWVVWSNEHHAYWRPNSAGYTRRIEDAGRYSYDEARAICFPGRGRAHVTEPDGSGDWPPPEMMFPDPLAQDPALAETTWRHFGRQLA
jgi:hypothetical protein